MDRIVIRRALLSVSDKTGLVELAKALAGLGIELISTGGTRQTLTDAGLKVVDVAEFTGSPEMLGGRVKTLHPRVHGGILHRREYPKDLAEAAAHGIQAIDMVVVNLYPFEKTVAREGTTLEEAIENIDIGGPSMIRSAAKNHSHVAVLTDPEQYASVAAELKTSAGALSRDTLAKLAVAAFAKTAAYDAAIHQYLSKPAASVSAFPASVSLRYELRETLRYGENPHQRAALYVDPQFRGASVVGATKLHGKELSYNNLLDLDSALTIVREFDRPAAVVIKHNNPCGAALGDDLASAFRKAWDGDPLSAFGSVLGFNRKVDAATASALVEPGRFVEAIIAPSFDDEAVRLLTTVPTWKNSVRLLACGDLSVGVEASTTTLQSRPIEGGLLQQSPDVGGDEVASAKVVTRKVPTAVDLRDLAFAWVMVKHVRSNAIVLVKDEAVVGVGAGQMSRVDAGRIAIEKAGDRAKGSMLASDAFFPFRDNVDQAAKAGIAGIAQPGGSKRDQESIDACDEHGIAMVFTGFRHFRH